MALLFADSIDLYGNNADLQAAGWTLNPSPNVSIVTNEGRFSNGCIKLESDGAVCRAITISGNVFIIQFAFKIDSLMHANNKNILKALNNSGVDMCAAVSFTQAGAVQLRDSSNTVVETSATGVIKEGAWQYLEAKVTISDSGSITVNIDETEAVTETNVDTKPGLATDVDQFEISGAQDAAGYFTRIDDVIVIDDSGTLNDDFIGDSTIDVLLPNSDDATDAAWLSQPSQSVGSEYLNIDDPVPGSDDGDTSYNHSNAVSADSLYGFDDMPDTPQKIHGVQLALSAKKSTGGTRTVSHLFKNDTKIIAAAFNPGTDYGLFRSIREQSADATPVDWTKTKVDTLLAGMRLTS